MPTPGGAIAWSSDSGPTSACGVRTPMRTVASQPSRFHLLRFSWSDMSGSFCLPLRPRTMMPAEEVRGEFPRMSLLGDSVNSSLVLGDLRPAWGQENGPPVSLCQPIGLVEPPSCRGLDQCGGAPTSIPPLHAGRCSSPADQCLASRLRPSAGHVQYPGCRPHRRIGEPPPSHLGALAHQPFPARPPPS